MKFSNFPLFCVLLALHCACTHDGSPATPPATPPSLTAEGRSDEPSKTNRPDRDRSLSDANGGHARVPEKQPVPPPDLASISEGCLRLCLTASPYCLPLPRTGFEHYPERMDGLLAWGQKLQRAETGIFNLDASGVAHFDFQSSGVTFRSALSPVNTIGFKRADTDHLKMIVTDTVNAPTLTIEDANLQADWGGQLISIEFIDTDPVLRTNSQSCVWIQSPVK